MSEVRFDGKVAIVTGAGGGKYLHNTLQGDQDPFLKFQLLITFSFL